MKFRWEQRKTLESAWWETCLLRTHIIKMQFNQTIVALTVPHAVGLRLPAAGHWRRRVRIHLMLLQIGCILRAAPAAIWRAQDRWHLRGWMESREGAAAGGPEFSVARRGPEAPPETQRGRVGGQFSSTFHPLVRNIPLSSPRSPLLRDVTILIYVRCSAPVRLASPRISRKIKTNNARPTSRL